MSIKRNVFSYTLYSGVSIYVESFIGLLISILISRKLGADELGVYSLMLWLSMLGVVLANGGLNTAVIKFLAEADGNAGSNSEKATLTHIFRIQLLFLPVAFIITMIAAYLMAGRVIDEQYTFLLFSVVIAIIPKSLQIFFLSVIKGYQSFKSIFFINIIVTPVNLLTVLMVILFDGGIEEFIYAYIFITLVYFICSLLFAKGVVSSKLGLAEVSPAEFQPRINNFIKFATLNAFLFFILDYGIEVMFLNWFSTSADAGYYTIGFRLAEMVVTLVPGVFGFVLLPIMAKSMGEGMHLVVHRFKESGRFLVIMSSPFMAFGVVFSEFIIERLYGVDLLPAAQPLRILLLFFSFTMLNTLTISILLSLDKQAILMKVLVVFTLINIVLDIVLISKFALTGALAASVISKLGFSISCQFLVSRLLKAQLPYLELTKLYLLSYFLLIPLYLLYTLTLNIWLVPLGGSIYFLLYFFLTMFWFKLSRDEVSIIHSYTQKIPVVRIVFGEKLFSWIDTRYEMRAN